MDKTGKVVSASHKAPQEAAIVAKDKDRYSEAAAVESIRSLARGILAPAQKLQKEMDSLHARASPGDAALREGAQRFGSENTKHSEFCCENKAVMNRKIHRKFKNCSVFIIFQNPWIQ